MNVAILGIDQPSQIVAEIIEQLYNSWLEQRLGEKLNVIAYVTEGSSRTPNIGNVPILNPVQFALLYHKKVIDKIILPRKILINNRFLLDLRALGIKLADIFITSRLNENISVFNFLEPYISSKFLPYIEFHIADHCNLNCKLCYHFSSLVKKPIFPIFEKFTQDFLQLYNFFDDIGFIKILGGEPLLNPEINEYVKLSRRLYPLADIHILTNAILLPKMPEDFFETLRACNVVVDISFYPPMQSKMPQIMDMLKDKQINANLGKLIDKFSVRQTQKKQDNINVSFTKCGSAICNFFVDGKIAICPQTAMTKYFNAYFNANLPEDGVIDLYEKDLSIEKIKRFLWTPFERCGYCIHEIFVKWETLKYPSQISDWAVAD